MKKVLLALVVFGTVSFSSCKKDELATPQINKVSGGDDDKEVCHECGGSYDYNGGSGTSAKDTNITSSESK